jgi:AraC-like DNA-binding protein
MGDIHHYWFVFTMGSNPFVSLPLMGMPRLITCANAVHGHLPVERYFTRGVWVLISYHYEADITVNGHDLVIKPGLVSLFPPDSRLQFRYRGRSRHTYANFTLPKSKAVTTLPMITDLGIPFAEFALRMAEMSRWSLPDRQLRADARLADLLWQVVDFHRGMISPGSSRHPTLDAAIEFIEEHLAEPLAVSLVARKVGISHNHLIRLFRAGLGETVVGYIRSRRALRARHLLEQTTQPMKTLARLVGAADGHTFNKLVRRELGHSPSQIRRGLRRKS